MVIISMLLAMGFFLLMIAGIVILAIGIIFLIVALVKRHHKKRSHIAFGIVSGLLISGGILLIVVPYLFVSGASALMDYDKNREIAELNEESLIYLDSNQVWDDEIVFMGRNYVRCPDNFLCPKGEGEAIGAFMYKNGNHSMIYKGNFEYAADDLIYAGSSVFCPEDMLDEVLDHYYNDASYYAVIYLSDKKSNNIGYDYLDSDIIRKIRDFVEENGEKDSENAPIHMDFYSVDGVYWLSMGADTLSGERIRCTYNGKSAEIPKEYAEYIRLIISDRGVALSDGE